MYRVDPLMNNHTMQCIATELSEVETKEKRTHNDLINARTLAALQEYQDTPENIPVQQQFSRHQMLRAWKSTIKMQDLRIMSK